MAISRVLPRKKVPDDAAAVTAPSTEGAKVEDDVLKLDGLYNSASNLEVELESVVRRGTATLTAGQVGAFNSVLSLARQLVPNSVALREDVDEIDATVRPIDAHKALHVTIVPTLHNALPEPLYDRHG